MRKIKIITLILVLFGGLRIYAADMYFATPKTSYGVNEEIQVALRISSPNEKINALEADIIFPDELVKFVDFYDNNSIAIPWWERPALNENVIHFSTGIVGGFDGLIDPFEPEKKKAGTVANFVFRAKNEGVGSFEIENDAVYLHDGKGTLGELSTAPLSFIIGPAITPAEYKLLDDRPPEPFEVLIDHSELIFDNQYFAAFQAEDSGSGIAFYKIKEGGGLWLPAESPYLLRNQKLTSVIKVKAVDKAGNERVMTVSPLTSKDLSYLWYVLAGLLLIFLVHLLLDHRRKTVYNVNVYEQHTRSKK